MPNRVRLPRGAYLAPYLHHSGHDVVILIDRGHRCIHTIAVEAGQTEQDAIERGKALLEVLDPPRKIRAA